MAVPSESAQRDLVERSHAARRKPVGGQAARIAELETISKSALAYIEYTLEYFDWIYFPNLRSETEVLRDGLRRAIHPEGEGNGEG